MNDDTLVLESVEKAYIDLLNKFCNNDNLINLVNHCIMDNIRQNEDVYLSTGRYPEKRDLMSKLVTDLKKAKINNIRKAMSNRGGENVQK